jgi:hypothetical protein
MHLTDSVGYIYSNNYTIDKISKDEMGKLINHTIESYI